ncbi:perakine reductase [Lathyrus oleraceus]|uniref:perakine reductase n=1 Tax=Pisum sativum TaxID=3888 RepID=UPI0021D34988|nr:perakine reductase-like [Pisum sativum]
MSTTEAEYMAVAKAAKKALWPTRELGTGIVAYSPLGRGVFAGKSVVETLPSQSLLNMHPRFTGENLEKNKCFYERINDLGSKQACTPSQLALAWLLHQGNDIIPIPGTTKLKNFENNIESLNVKLTEEQLREISDAVPVEEIGGKRDYGSLSQYMWKFSTTPH